MIRRRIASIMQRMVHHAEDVTSAIMHENHTRADALMEARPMLTLACRALGLIRRG